MTETTRPIIEITQLVKTYGVLPVLRGLDLTVTRGEFLALLGSNGSGKSTLLRLLTGVSHPTSGQILVGGWEIPKEAAAVRAQIGLVSHKPLLYENLTARENLQFFGRLYHLPADSLDERINERLRQVGLYKRMYDLTRTFSRGMLQRLSIARALLHDPHILLLDEPYTGLDPDAAQILDAMLRATHAAEHTIIMTTHQLDRAVDLSSRIVILAQGKIGYAAPSATLNVLQLANDYAAITGMATPR